MAASVGAPCLQPPATATVGLWAWTTEQRRKVGWSCESCLCLWYGHWCVGCLGNTPHQDAPWEEGQQRWCVSGLGTSCPSTRAEVFCCLAKRCCAPCTPLNAMIWPNLPSKLHIWLSICGTWWTKSPTCDVRDYQDMDTFRPSCWDTW